MAEVSYTSIRRRLLSCLTALALLSATLPGCLASGMIEKTAMGDPKEATYFALSASVNTYEITRWLPSGQETFSVPRNDENEGREPHRLVYEEGD
jgi:hypothetical protein